MKIIVFHTFFTLFFILSPSVQAAKCNVSNTLCVMAEIKKDAISIENKEWREKALRDLAKTYTQEGYENKAIELINQIQTPDTKARTIQGIGIAAAEKNWSNKKRYKALFSNLAKEVEKLDHAPSYASAYSYIARAQTLSGDNDGAMETARNMKNSALRHKTLGDIAKIQAEKNNVKLSMKSVSEIESEDSRNKAYSTIARIFIRRGKLEPAYIAGQKITNAYIRTQILQSIINYENAEQNLSVETQAK